MTNRGLTEEDTRDRQMAKLSFGWRKTTVEWTSLRWLWSSHFILSSFFSVSSFPFSLFLLPLLHLPHCILRLIIFLFSWFSSSLQHQSRCHDLEAWRFKLESPVLLIRHLWTLLVQNSWLLSSCSRNC
jgi:hypothetical protein